MHQIVRRAFDQLTLSKERNLELCLAIYLDYTLIKYVNMCTYKDLQEQ